MKRITKTLICLLCFTQINAQQSPQPIAAKNNEWKTFEQAERFSATELAGNKTALQLSADENLNSLSVQEDELGFKHFRYQQTYKGIPIEGSLYLLHEKNARVRQANGRLVRGLSLSVTPGIDETTGLQAALQHMNASRYAWQELPYESVLKQIKNQPAATFYPSGELVIIHPKQYEQPVEDVNNYRLAYKFSIHSLEPLSDQLVYVDAQTAQVLTTLEKIHHCNDIPLSGTTNYADIVDFTGCQNAGTYTLKNNIGGGMQVFNANNTDGYPTTSISDTDAFFDTDPTAVEVLWASEKTYEYYLTAHNRNSLDGAGMPINSWVHFREDYVNAFWNSALSVAVYGDGNAAINSLTSPDIVAHELTHGLTQFTAGLVYSYESGALNESFSDIFGEMVEATAYPDGNDWVLGADVINVSIYNGFRNISNPKDDNMLNPQPDTYLGNKWYDGTADFGGVHTNSGVQNYWFYLLSEGGTGTNDNGDFYNISGIGKNKAAAIAYRNLTVYLTSISQYADARTGSIAAAQDLLDAEILTASDVQQVADAWCAVGVGCLPPVVPCRETDSLALVALYNSSDGANWTDPWDLTDPLEAWEGLTLNNDGCVLRLSLSNRQLNGTLPVDLGNLTSITDLFIISNNGLTGNIPPELGNLENLGRLYLSNNELTGNIPPELANLSNLYRLYLYNNNLTGSIPTEFGSMPNLEYLWLYENQLSGSIPASLGNMGELFDLNLRNNNLTGNIPANLGNATNLSKLNLNNNGLTGNMPSELGNLNNLTFLYIENNNLGGTLLPELGLIGLTGLHIADNQFSGCYPPEWMNLCNQLFQSTNLQISDNNNLDADWEDFCSFGDGACSIPAEFCRPNDSLLLVTFYNATDGPNWNITWDLSEPVNTWHGVTATGFGCVTGLSLASNNLSGNLLPALSTLPYLTHLNLFNNQLIGTIPAELGSLSNLTELNLGANSFVGSIPDALGNMVALTSLSLSNNSLTGIIPDTLGSLNNLRTLSLSDNNLSGTIPVQIFHPNLRVLYLSNNQLSGSIPLEIGNSDLYSLFLNNNQLSGSIPREIENLTDLAYLHLNDNQLSGSLPEEMGNLLVLVSLYLHNNQFSGCYSPALAVLCDSNIGTSYSINVSTGNNFDASWADFCNFGAGSCVQVWPGDFNNDGLANYADVLYWGVAAGNEGAVRVNPTTNWVNQDCSIWQQDVNGTNGRYQDANGDGLVNEDDFDVLLQNYGLTHGSYPLAYSGSPVRFRLEWAGSTVGGSGYEHTFELYVESFFGTPVSLHGVSCSIDFSEMPGIMDATIDTTGSPLKPSYQLEMYNPVDKTLDIGLTRTDKNNKLIINEPVAACIVVSKDIPSNDPIAITINNNTLISANGALSAAGETTVYGILGEPGIIPELTVFISTTNEQCDALGQAAVQVFDGIGAYTYAWSNGASTAEIVELIAGEYTLTVTDEILNQEIITIQINEPEPVYDQSGNLIPCDSYNPWIVPELCAFLEGAYNANTGAMNNTLQQKNMLLDGQPYNQPPWNYFGTEGAGWTAADYPPGSIDWVLVTFRTGANAETVIRKTAAILQEDGCLYFPDTNVLSANIVDAVYVVIEHRNHVAVMTPTPIEIVDNVLTYDFRLNDSYALSGSSGQKLLPDGNWTMYAGDCDQSNPLGYDINGSDKALWSVNNGIFNEYISPDLNLDGDINGGDKALWSANNGISSIVPK